MRVAVSQFATSSNVQENLATCIRMIDDAVACKPSLIVLPEFSNTSFNNIQPYNAKSQVIDHNQTWNDALAIDGPFLQRIAERSKQYQCYIALNVTVRREPLRTHQDSKIKSNISVTSCLFSPCGSLIHQADKQTLTAYENECFTRGNKRPDTITTPFGTLGLLAGTDCMTFEVSRGLALQGAQLLCNSINSLALDQSQLHEPARACENKVFLASANKIGLLPSENEASQAEATQQEPSKAVLASIGQSQILAPNGQVLAKINNNVEGFVFADIDLAGCGVSSTNIRPDGTNIFKQRRPELYQNMVTPLNNLLTTIEKPEREDKNLHSNEVPLTTNVVIFATYKSNEQAIEDVCYYIENNLSDIIQLPELFFIADKNKLNNIEQRMQIEQLSKQLIKQISAELRPFQYVCTSLVIDGLHQAVILNEHGIFALQKQLHFCQRYAWTQLGDKVNRIELPLEQGSINVAMLTADDANIPEIVGNIAVSGIHVLLVPFDIQEPCEVEYSLLARAVENRICIVAASHEKSFSTNLLTNNDNQNTTNKKKIKPQKSTGIIVNLTTDSTLLTQWKPNKHQGFINAPLVKQQQGKITKAVIHPIAACHKLSFT
jgi:predicted amidohydrolase